MGDSIFLGTWVESLADEVKTPSQLAAIENISGGSSTFTETLWTDNTGNYFVRVDTAGVISWTNMLGVSTTAPGTGAKPASGGGTSGSLAETLWVDDSLAYFVRIDTGLAITWVTPTGGVPPIAPGTGLRPAAGASIIVDSSRYQATAAGTGFAINDYLSHVVTVDPATGAVVANFWLNVTSPLLPTKLTASPSASSITPISSLPLNAALETGGNLALTAATLGGVADTKATNGISSWSAIALLKWMGTSLASMVTALGGTLAFNLSQIGGNAVSSSNGVPIYDAYMAPQAVTWNYGQAVPTYNSVLTSGMDTVIVTLVTNASTTGGTIVFEVYDGVTWLPIKAASILDYTTTGTSIALSASMSKGYQVPVAGFPNFRVRLASALVGASSALTNTIVVSSAPDTSILTVGLDPAQALPAGSNALGSVGVTSLPSLVGGAAQIGSLVDNSVGSCTVNSSFGSAGTGILTGFPLSTAGFAKMYVFVSSAASYNGTTYFEGSNDGWLTSTFVLGLNLTQGGGAFNAGAFSLSTGATTGLIYEVPLTHAAIRIRSNVFGSGTINIQWVLKSVGVGFKTQVDQGGAGTTSGAWNFALTDRSNTAAVKPTTVPALFSDPALVVVASPNSDAIFGSALTATAIGALVGTVGTAFPATGISTAGFAKLVLTCTAGNTSTIAFQGSNDGGTVWEPILAARIDVTTSPPSSQQTSFATGNIYELPCSHALIRLYCSAYTSQVSFSWCLKAASMSHMTVDQGAANSTSLWGFQPKASGIGNLSTASTGTLNLVTAATTNVTAVKATNGALYLIDASNTSATVWAYLHLYNGTPAMGTTPAVATYALAPGASRTISFSDIGLAFASNITASVTLNAIATDNTALTVANQVIANFHFV